MPKKGTRKFHVNWGIYTKNGWVIQKGCKDVFAWSAGHAVDMLSEKKLIPRGMDWVGAKLPNRQHPLKR